MGRKLFAMRVVSINETVEVFMFKPVQNISRINAHHKEHKYFNNKYVAFQIFPIFSFQLIRDSQLNQHKPIFILRFFKFSIPKCYKIQPNTIRQSIT